MPTTRVSALKLRGILFTSRTLFPGCPVYLKAPAAAGDVTAETGSDISEPRLMKRCGRPGKHRLGAQLIQEEWLARLGQS